MFKIKLLPLAVHGNPSQISVQRGNLFGERSG